MRKSAHGPSQAPAAVFDPRRSRGCVQLQLPERALPGNVRAVAVCYACTKDVFWVLPRTHTQVTKYMYYYYE